MKEVINTKAIYTKLIHSKTKYPILLTGWREEIKWGKNKDGIDTSYYLSIQPAHLHEPKEVHRFSMDSITLFGGIDYKVGSLAGIAAFQRCVQVMLYNTFSDGSAHKRPSDKDLAAGNKFILEHGCGIRCFKDLETGSIDVDLVFGEVTFNTRWREPQQLEFTSKEITAYLFTIIKEVDIFFKKAPSLHDGSHAISKGIKD